MGLFPFLDQLLTQTEELIKLIEAAGEPPGGLSLHGIVPA